MRDDDDEFLRSIPQFLRRCEARRSEAPRGPEALAPEKSAARMPGPAGEERAAEPIEPAESLKPISASAGPAAQTAQAPDSGAPDSGAQTAAPRIVELAARQAEAIQAETGQDETGQTETAQAGENPAGQRARIELAFDNETASADVGAEDVAFQVTLPRSVVRQIRVLAAKKDTTQRAIVLRALRQAGLWVPEGTDVDRRGRTAKRRQHA
jgi:hypothetical protein